MGIYKNICIGHVETVDLNSKDKKSLIQNKVVALSYIGTDKITSLPKYKPLRKYTEHYKIISVDRISGLVNDKMINNAIKRTGKEEVKKLKKSA